MVLIERIYKYGSPVLRKKSKPLKEVGEKERLIFKRMLEVMYKDGGIGLAAPQVGISRQMIAVDIGDCPVMLANPKILKRKGHDVLAEGCLSLPGVNVEIKRATHILVEGLNEDNKKIKFHAEGLLARAILHETDHLKGKLIIDYASITEKLRLRKKLKEMADKEAQ